jgi:peptide/nickel transport system substrate-binding protein
MSMSELTHLQSLVQGHRLSRRAFLGRATALGLSLTAAGTLYGKALKAATPQRGGTLIAGLVGGETSNSLDPATFASQVPYWFGKSWGDQLIQTEPGTGAPIPGLAESWEGSDDVKTWVFKIRSGVTFHNGKTLEGADVVATIERHSDENSKSGALGLLGGIEKISADGNTVTVTLKEPNADLPLLLSDYHLIIQPDGGKDAPAAGIGTGPYIVEVTEHGVRYAAKKNPNYWRDDSYFDAVELLVINDATARAAALQSGQVHIINRVEPKTANLLKQMAGVVIENVGGKAHYVFIMHCNAAPFDNADLRLALKLAMDREAMVQNVLQGFGTVGNDFPINKAYDLFPEGIEQRLYDPDKAAFHYKKSGHSGSILLRTSDVAFPGAVDAAVLYQQQAGKAGITIEVQQEPGDGYWNNVWNVQPFSTSYWGGRPTQDQMYSTAYISTADWNDTRFLRPDFDKIIQEARGELDRARRAELYRAAALMVRDEGGLILPMFNDWIDAHSDKLQGYVKDGSGEQSNGYVMRRAWLV